MRKNLLIPWVDWLSYICISVLSESINKECLACNFAKSLSIFWPVLVSWACPDIKCNLKLQIFLKQVSNILKFGKSYNKATNYVKHFQLISLLEISKNGIKDTCMETFWAWDRSVSNLASLLKKNMEWAHIRRCVL